MPGMLTLDALREHIATGSIDTVLACQVDMQGRLMGKRFHADYFADRAWQETHSCNYLLATDIEMETVPGYAATSWAKGYGDYIMRPDMSTLRHIPWLDGTALVICDVLDHHTHEEVAHSPRALLKREIARYATMGQQPMMASELEFFIFRESFEKAHKKAYRRLNTISAYNEDYHIFQTTKEEHIMRAIRNGLHNAGVPVENSKGEAWAGQEEINVQYAGALEMADRHAIIKNACKEIAWRNGHAVTFMAKWDYDAAGSSAHIHQSLWSGNGKTPLFHDAEQDHGMSDVMRAYLAGLLHHSSEITWCLAPYINSYKRFQTGTFAPTKAIWSLDNRTAGYRLCAADTEAVRVECRVGGADLNPYLAFTALLAAGRAGIEGQLSLEPAYAGDAYHGEQLREIPKTLRDAAAAMDQSAMLREAFGDAVVDHYVHAANWEQAEYDRRVTDWEIFRGFERA